MKDYIRLHGGALVYPDGSVAFPQVADWFDVKAHQLSPSQIEVTAKRPRYYLEGTEDDLTQDQQAQLRRIRLNGLPEPTEAELEARKALSLKVAANRAKTRVRKLCKAMGASTLLTLTYRANQGDLALCKRHLAAFVRSVRKYWPDFQAVASFETQKRGAWHVHLALAGVPSSFTLGNVHGIPCRVKSFNVIRDTWRRVVGEHGGNIDVSRRKAHSRKSPAKIAAYLSKYIVKAFEQGEAYTNRWTKFGDCKIPAVVELGRAVDPLGMIVDCYGLLGDCTNVATAIWSRFGDWFYLASESPS
ncbi:MAG: hypothetical protein AB7P37_07340 [Ramlibacter sp.]